MEGEKMTVQEIRAAVGRGKAQAAARIDREMGAGAFARIAAYSASEKNRAALAHIANVCKAEGI
jgi:hypothetical protein